MHSESQLDMHPAEKVQLLHGPDGRLYTKHSDVIGGPAAWQTVPADGVSIGDSDDSIMLGEFLNLAFAVRDSATTSEQWVVVDVYEIRKAF